MPAQVGRLPRAVLNDLAPVLRPGEVADVHGRGYFKLKRAERRDAGFAAIPPGQPRLLVVEPPHPLTNPFAPRLAYCSALD